MLLLLVGDWRVETNVSVVVRLFSGESLESVASVAVARGNPASSQG